MFLRPCITINTHHTRLNNANAQRETLVRLDKMCFDRGTMVLCLLLRMIAQQPLAAWRWIWARCYLSTTSASTPTFFTCPICHAGNVLYPLLFSSRRFAIQLSLCMRLADRVGIIDLLVIHWKRRIF